MKELNKFRKFLSENALGVDREDGTFEITPDIEIMGQSFNFSDICPSAHNLVKKLADENPDSPEVLNFAIIHRDFFALEKKALGPQKITVDEYKNDVTRLYVNIINAADKLGVRREAKRYMDMHIGKIKDAGFKASEPGGSSDRNFEEQLKEVRSRLKDEVEGYTDLHKNDVVLESFLGEEELEENKKYADDQLKFKKGDTVYFKNVKGGKKLPMTITGPGKFMKSNRLDAGGKEVVFPVKGGPGGKGMYAADDLVKEESLEENDTPWKVTVTDEKTGEKSSFLYKDENDAIRYAQRVNDEHGGYSAVVNVMTEDLEESLEEAAKPDEKEVNTLAAKLMKDPKFKSRYRGKQGVDFIKHAKAVALKSLQGQKKIEEGPVKTFTNSLNKYQSYPHVYVFKVRTMSTDKQGGKFVYNNTYEVKDGLDWNGVLAQVDQLIASPETISVGVDIYYTTGQEEGQLGGQAEVVRWTHDAWYKDAKSDYILNARENQFENEEAERIIAIRKFLNSSSMGRPPQNVDDQAEKLYPAIKRMKDEVARILAAK